MNKTPRETWKNYSSLFVSASTGRISAPLLAALAQVESQGNPLAAPSWRFQLSSDVQEVYAPASSAFGLMQITKGTFELILRSCGKSGEDCPHRDFATRMRARDSVVMTSGFLQRTLESFLSKQELHKLSDERLTKLVSTIHLCGPEVARRLIRNRYNINSLGRCGGHWPNVYSGQVADMRNLFELLSSREQLLAGE